MESHRCHPSLAQARPPQPQVGLRIPPPAGGDIVPHAVGRVSPPCRWRHRARDPWRRDGGVGERLNRARGMGRSPVKRNPRQFNADGHCIIYDQFSSEFRLHHNPSYAISVDPAYEWSPDWHLSDLCVFVVKDSRPSMRQGDYRVRRYSCQADRRQERAPPGPRRRGCGRGRRGPPGRGRARRRCRRCGGRRSPPGAARRRPALRRRRRGRTARMARRMPLTRPSRAEAAEGTWKVSRPASSSRPRSNSISTSVLP